MPTPPFTREQIEELTKTHSTPFHVYYKQGIIQTARRFNSAFPWVSKVNGRGFQNYFAVKALPNPSILELLAQEGSGADCSSLPELMLAQAVGIKGENIMFTSNDTPAEEFVAADSLGAVINLDDITYVSFLEKILGRFPELLSFRYNPGPLRTGTSIIGNPQETKYGVRDDQIVQAYRLAKEKGARRFGLHTMIVSNMRDEEYLVETARMLFDLAERINKETGIRFEFVNLGGGVGIPYAPEHKEVDIERFANRVEAEYKRRIEEKGLSPLRVVMECGRAITGPSGWLVSRVRHVTHKYRDFVGLDACAANLMRPMMYGASGGAYHDITVLGKENALADHLYDVTGGLCEGSDKFAVQRFLPEIKPGDLVAIHNTGAHGHAMGFNYNGKLRSPEFLFDDRTFEMIRRAETDADYFATLAYPGSKFAHLAQT